MIKISAQDKNKQVEIQSTRPLYASQILIGKTPEQALSTLPLLFNICGIAQSHAGYLAIEQKMNRKKDFSQQTAREMLVLAENAREYLLRLFLDAPSLFQIDNSTLELSYLGQMTKAFSSALFKEGRAFAFDSQLNAELSEVTLLIDKLEQFLIDTQFQMPLNGWANLQNDTLQQWAKEYDSLAGKIIKMLYDKNWTSQGYADFNALPVLDEKELLETFNASKVTQFIAQPEWQGQCFETSALSRQFSHPLVKALHQKYSTGLITRWVARLTELASIPDQMRQLHKQIINHDSFIAKENEHSSLGIAQVEAARGRLVHQVEI